MPCLVQALERGPEASSSSDEEQEEEEGASAAPSARKPKAYDTEQEQLRRSFLEAAKDAGRQSAVLVSGRGKCRKCTTLFGLQGA
eukprot:scaffold22643_cov18-Tisochrysis_lutea.AAC.3